MFLSEDGTVRLGRSAGGCAGFEEGPGEESFGSSGDFGLCRNTRKEKQKHGGGRGALMASEVMSQAGTDCYMAPEMLASSRYGKPVGEARNPVLLRSELVVF